MSEDNVRQREDRVTVETLRSWSQPNVQRAANPLPTINIHEFFKKK